MKQQTFSDIEYSHRKKKTKREEFLTAMDQIIPWQQWIDLMIRDSKFELTNLSYSNIHQCITFARIFICFYP